MTLYADVTARIIAELEKGATPWIKPWSAGAAGGAGCSVISAVKGIQCPYQCNPALFRSP